MKIEFIDVYSGDSWIIGSVHIDGRRIPYRVVYVKMTGILRLEIESFPDFQSVIHLRIKSYINKIHDTQSAVDALSDDDKLKLYETIIGAVL